MGNLISGYIWRESGEANDTIVENDPTTQDNSFFRLSRKRKSSPVRVSSKESGQTSPKVIKLDTAKYLHQKLFVEGKKSDVTLVASGREWHLHKIYLEQCDYFRCLFSGNWLDSSENRFELPIYDDRITFEGLDTVFASLYQNEIRFDLKDLSGILSASALFNLQVCIERCEEQMLQSINGDSVIEFLELSKSYGCLRSKDQCIAYLARFYWKLSQNDEFLKKLSYDLMLLIYSQPELCIVEGEKDMYNAMKRWIFIQCEDKIGRPSAEISQYFTSKPSYHFYEYKELLKLIRYQHMITSKRTLECLKMEHIIGGEVLTKVINIQWEDLLLNEEKELLEDTISDEYFYAHCRRLGRALTEDKCWRWAGIDFGLDLLFRCQFGMISMIRNLSRDTVPQSLSLRKEYKIHFRLLVLNSDGDIVADTKRKMVNLGVDQKQFLASYPVEMKEFSVHLFYINYLPSSSPQAYWNDVKTEITT